MKKKYLTIEEIRNFVDISRCYHPMNKQYETRIKFYDEDNKIEEIKRKFSNTILQAYEFERIIKDQLKCFYEVEIKVKGNDYKENPCSI
jgi:hypothetical protein